MNGLGVGVKTAVLILLLRILRAKFGLSKLSAMTLNIVLLKRMLTFLSESADTKIHHRLLIATTDGIVANAVGVIKRQNETAPINKLMLSELLEAPINWPESLDELSKAGVKKAFTPKPYQRKAIDKVTANLDSRGQIIMACGTGKILTALWIAEQLKADTTPVSAVVIKDANGVANAQQRAV